MVLSFVPFAKPEDVFCRGWDLALRAGLGLVCVTEL